MNTPRSQSGLSLITVVIVMALLSLAAMAGMYMMRYGKLPWQDAWDTWSGHGSQAVILDKVQQEVKSASSQGAAGAEVRRCTIKGKVVYSNVDCLPEDGGRKVVLHDTRGIEPPKVPVEASSGSSSDVDDIKGKMVEKALSTGK
jgi:hypothetical protein